MIRETKRLDEIGTIVTGTTPHSSLLHSDARAGIPFLTPTDIQHRELFTVTERFLAEDAAAQFSTRLLPVGATAVTCIGASIGKTTMTKVVSLTNQQVNSVIPFPDYDQRFVYYSTLTVVDHFADIAGGSATPILNKSAFSEIRIPVAPINTQKGIALVLGSLDAKIEANQLAIRAGHDLLLALYKATPKHTTESFEQVCGVFGGSTPSTKRSEFWGGGIQWATPTDLTALKGPWLTGTERTITDAGLQSMSSSLHPEGSILMTSRATIGSVALAAEPVATNQGFIVVRASEELTPWIFCQFQDRVHEFEAWSNGATFLELSRGNFKKLPFYRAEPGALETFNQEAWPILRMCKAKQAENLTLTKTRDELLPLLMSGKITVKDAEQEANAAGADIASEENKA
ncbi:restriction endonuclease subunit S [Corynebacterium sanguinis]|uniref:restriction endonuclease subunit S n=1 Tax=Corynebacterium sanguinis TaxID=2594913 RepID=UPI0021AFBBCC|nr:restriction endonuclease subunit S [Corynebacterium sanguinis]MCT1628996.1 restriction endonuclease subunit S [Corynebacterium sanguinis]